MIMDKSLEQLFHSQAAFKEYFMTPLWLETHASYISSNRDTTADQITFNGGSLFGAALLKVPLLAADVLGDGTPLTVEITVANDVSIGQTPGSDSDITYGVSDGNSFIGFEAVDRANYPLWAPCSGAEAKSGEVLTAVNTFDKKIPLPGASFYPPQFVFTLKLDQPWGSCFTPHGGGFIKTAKYTKQLMLSHGLTLEVYKKHARESVGIKHITITVMKTDGQEKV